MKSKVDAIAICAVLLCSAVIVGEYLTYSPGVHEYSATATWNDNSVDYTISSSGSDAYSAVLIDSNGRIPVDSITILFDGHYLDHFEEVQEQGRATYIDQQYYVDQITGALRMRNFTAVDVCDEGSLSLFISGSINNAAGKGLLVMTYALPSDIYDGTPECPLMQWVANGGTLYWVGSEIGAYCIENGELVRIADNQTMLFGHECVNISGPEVADEADNEGFCEALALKGAGNRFSVDVSSINGGLAIGFGSGGYRTISFVPFGNGQICVFGGYSSMDHFDDIGQTIAAGLSCSSEIAGHQDGIITRSTISSTFAPIANASTLYVFTGGIYLNYGCAFHA